MKFREHRGGYHDSMETVVELPDRAALIEHIRGLLSPYEFHFEPADITVAPYFGMDPRNGWDTHIVHLRRYGVIGFTDAAC